MKKTLVAVAALAAVGGASAQVTISGYFGASYDQFSLGNVHNTRLGNTSETRISDQSSRILFNVNEDLGGGLSAVAQYDLRFKVDAAARIQAEPSAAVASINTTFATATVAAKSTQQQPAVDPVSNGNIHVGLASKEWGSVRFGRQDVYYTEQPNLMPGGLFLASNQQPVFHSLATANASRTPNFLWYTSNNINGFTGQLGYSTNPLRTSATSEVEADMGGTLAASQRKGSGVYWKLNYVNGPVDATLAGIDYKSDYIGTGSTDGLAATGNLANAAGTGQSANADQKGTTFVVKFQVNPALRLAYGRSDEKQIYAVTTAQSTTAPTASFTNLPDFAKGDVVSAVANSFSAAYVIGNNQFTYNFAKRGNLAVNGAERINTGISQSTFAYNYNLSKNTAVGVMYTEQSVDSDAVGGLFYQGNNAYGGQIAGLRGETHRITSFALRQNF